MKRTIFAALLAALAVAQPAAAYPDKPIQVLIPWPPGQATDLGVRAVIGAMSKHLGGVPLTAINKPGAQGVTATSELVAAKPDGYTVGAITIGPIVPQVLTGDAPYASTDLEPIGLFTTLPFVLVVKADLNVKTVKELAALQKSRGKPLVLGHPGTATVPTQTIFRLAKAEGFAIKEITYAQVTYNTLDTGDADMIVVTSTPLIPYIKDGKARALVALTPKRIGALPEVPTTREAGYGFDVSVWNGMFAPKGTPKAMIDKLAGALEKALGDPAVKDFEAKSGSAMLFVGPDAARKQIAAELEGLKPTMAELGLLKKK